MQYSPSNVTSYALNQIKSNEKKRWFHQSSFINKSASPLTFSISSPLSLTKVYILVLVWFDFIIGHNMWGPPYHVLGHVISFNPSHVYQNPCMHTLSFAKNVSINNFQRFYIYNYVLSIISIFFLIKKSI